MRTDPAGSPWRHYLAGAAAPPAAGYDADIVLLALDRIEATEQAICSALSQTGCSRHLTIVDQGSDPANLARLIAAVRGRSDATLFAVGRNLGVAGGRNLASAVGHGRVLIGLDNDAEFADANTVRRAVDALDAEPDLAAIGFRILLYANGAEDLGSWGYPTALLAQVAGRFDTTTFVGAGHAIRRTAWRDCGGYDPALFFCWEEFDFSLRAVAKGWRIAYRGEIAVRHKVTAEARVGWSGQRWFYFVRNRLYIERKWGKPWLALAPRAAAYLVKGGRHGLLGPTLRGIAAAATLPIQTDAGALPAAALDYLWRNDSSHRGNAASRLRTEMLARLPDARQSRSSIGSTAGQSSR